MAPRLGFAALAAAAAIGSIAPVTPQPAAGSRPNVVLVTIDTLRADYVGCYGNTRVATPTLDALAADGTLFERAFAQAPMTPPSHASILTGTYPPTHGVRDFTTGGLRPGFPTLAGLLKAGGYTTAAFVSAYVLDSAWGLHQGFDLYYDRFTPREFHGINPGNVQRRASETIDLVLGWLDGKPRNPYFLWVHLYDPHHDYRPPEPFRTRYDGDPYGGEVAYTDQQLGRLIAAMRKRGDYDGSLIVVTSDHGEGLGEHEETEHGFFVYNATTRIPLVVKPPRKAAPTVKRAGTLVDTVDIAPTILDVAGVPLGRVQMQGRTLVPLVAGRSRGGPDYSYSETFYPRSTFGWSQLISYSSGRYKYIQAPRPELYDVTVDPGEKTNLIARERAVASRMQVELDRLRQRLEAPAATGAAPQAAIDPERLERLRSLGYLAVSAPSGGKVLADPKDRIRLFNKVMLALQAAEAGAVEKSNSLLEEVLRGEPNLFVAHYSLGINSARSGDMEAALRHLGAARNLNPSFDLIDISRGTALARLGRLDEAVTVLQDALRRNPTRLEAKRQLGQVYVRKKEFARAIEIYTEIAAGRPEDPQAAKALGMAQIEAQSYQDGAGMLRKAVSLGANDAVTWNFLGIALANTGQLEEALASYRKALEIKADYHQARLNLAFALLKAGNPEGARREFALLCEGNAALCSQYARYFR